MRTSASLTLSRFGCCALNAVTHSQLDWQLLHMPEMVTLYASAPSAASASAAVSAAASAPAAGAASPTPAAAVVPFTPPAALLAPIRDACFAWLKEQNVAAGAPIEKPKQK
jgi:predicted component of type VI protein secretion system